MFSVCVTMRIRPEAAHLFMPLMNRNAQLSLEREDGCRRFDVWTDPNRPGEVFLYEIYDSSAAFDAHLATPHFKEFDGAIADMVLDKTVRTYRECHP